MGHSICSRPLVRPFNDAGGQAGEDDSAEYGVDCDLQGPSLSDDGMAVEALMRMCVTRSC